MDFPRNNKFGSFMNMCTRPQDLIIVEEFKGGLGELVKLKEGYLYYPKKKHYYTGLTDMTKKTKGKRV